MKKTIFAAAAALLLTAAGASAQILTAFNFNDGQASGAQANATTYASTGGLQTSTITTNFPAANAVVFAGSTVNAVNGDVAGNALSLVGSANNGDYVQFSLNTNGYTSLYLNYATRTSGATTGFTLQSFSYSTDGTTFTNFGSASGYGTAFVSESAALPAAALNQAALSLRITFSGATTTTSNNRIDNLSVSTTAASVPEPATYAYVVAGLGALAFGVRRRRVA